MKKVFHIINGIISALLLITGIRMLISAKPELLMSYIGGLVLIVLSSIALITGFLLPKRKMESTNGLKRGRVRGWEPIVAVIWLFFYTWIVIFVYVLGSGQLKKLALISFWLMVILAGASLIWKLLDNKETYGKYALPAVLLPILVVAAIFGGSVAWGYVKEFGLPKKQPHRIEQTELPKAELETGTFAEILDQIQKDFDGQKLYYAVQTTEDGTKYVVAWNDEEETVSMYQLKKENEQYIIVSKMQSQALTKEDVLGKHQGVIEKK